MVDEAPLSPEAAARSQQAFDQLLGEHPDCGIGAVGPSGLFVPMPESIVVDRHTVLEARSGVDLVVPDDRSGMARTWGEARASGTARILVRLLDGHVAMCHVFDVRDRHGVWVLLFVLVQDQERGFRGSFGAAPPIVPRVCELLLEETSVIAEVNDAATGMLGWDRVEMVGTPSLELIHPDDHVRAIDTWMATLTTPDVAHRIRCRYQRKDETWLWVEATMQVRSGDDEGCVQSELVDISEEMAAHELVRSRERLLYQLTEALPSGVVQVDRAGTIVHKNDRVEEIVGRPDATTLSDQFAGAIREDRLILDEAIAATLGDGLSQDVEVRLEPDEDRLPRVCQVLLRPLMDEAGDNGGAIVSISDVTESTVLRTELQVRANFDALTRVHSRASIMAMLTTALLQQGPEHAGVAVIFIDLDRFKLVNDHFGHSTGDDLLIVVAERLRGGLRNEDTVGRLGGDEFLVVCPTMTSAADAHDLAGLIADRLHGPVVLRSGSVDLCASVGVAWSADPSTTADSLVARADVAMYESKRAGVGRPVLSGEIRAS